jgi:hypothetical protein
MLNSLKDKQGILCLLLETANMRAPEKGSCRHELKLVADLFYRSGTVGLCSPGCPRPPFHGAGAASPAPASSGDQFCRLFQPRLPAGCRLGLLRRAASLASRQPPLCQLILAAQLIRLKEQVMITPEGQAEHERDGAVVH